MYLSGGIYCWMSEHNFDGSQESSFINKFARSVIDSDMTPHSKGFGLPPNVARNAMYKNCLCCVIDCIAVCQFRWALRYADL